MLSTRFLCALAASLGSLALAPLPCGAQQHASAVQATPLGQSPAGVGSLDRIQTMLADDPGNAHLRFERARLLEARGLHDRAMADYRWLLDHHPELPEAYNNMARLLALRGDFDLAITTLEQGMATNATYHTMFTNLRTIFDTLAQRAYRSALREPESAGDVQPSPDTGIPLIAVERLSGHTVVERPSAPVPDHADERQIDSADHFGNPLSPRLDVPGHEN